MTTEGLKAEARRLRAAVAEMFDVNPTHSQSLELIAKTKNYPNWDAASGSSHVSGMPPDGHVGQSATTTASSLFSISQHGLIIVAATGTGKHLHALHAIQDQLQMGKTVVILDAGRSYLKLAQAVGGRFVWLLENNQYELRVFGHAPLIVYDIERMPMGIAWSGELPLMSAEVLSANGFIAIDEIGRVLRDIPVAGELTSRIAHAGGSYLAVAQDEEQAATLATISMPFVMKMHLERS